MKKYQKVSAEDYQIWYQENQAYRDRVASDENRLWYHLMPETGWLNDPNGLCQLGGVYHIYFQYTPFEPTGELKLWGHYTTRDFIHYTACDPVLYPDKDFDAHGVYSGSAMVEDGEIHFYYTGNVKYFDREDYDYILSGRGSATIHCVSRDGFHFSSKEVLLCNDDYPSDVSCHVRDPKVLKHEGAYYMVLGARDVNSRGLILVYRSLNRETWTYHGRITVQGSFGYMWECPDLFFLDGQLCLICCPQGVEQQGLDYANIHQCTVIPLDYDFSPGVFQIKDISDFRMVDRGFDFYAPQTFSDERGRRILIGWMGIPDADYTNPTADHGWQHALTIPRVLSMEEGRLIQQPVEEMKYLRAHSREYDIAALNQAGESGLVFELEAEFSHCESMVLTLREHVFLTWERGVLTLDESSCGCGRTRRSVKLTNLFELRIFSDQSSLEIFVNHGQEVFTSRVYSRQGGVRLEGDCAGKAIWHDLGAFVYKRMEN